MCNVYNLRTNFSLMVDRAAKQLRLPIVFGAGLTAETSNMQIPEALYPKKDGLFLRPVDTEHPEAGLTPAIGRFGLVEVQHRKGLKDIRFPYNNARGKTITETWPFRFSVRNRCIIPLTGFTEWTGPEKSKTAHTITAADGGMLFAAGLWTQADHTLDGPVTSYTMLTAAVLEEDDIFPFHRKGQPVFLDAPRARHWLDPDLDHIPLLTALPRGSLVFDPATPAAA